MPSGVTDVGVKKQFTSETSKLNAVCFAQLTLARWSWEPGWAVILSFNHGHPFVGKSAGSAVFRDGVSHLPFPQRG